MVDVALLIHPVQAYTETVIGFLNALRIRKDSMKSLRGRLARRTDVDAL